MTSHLSNKDSENRARHAAHGTVGPHNTKIANKLDPRVNSDTDNRDPAEKHLGSVHDYGKGGMKSSTTSPHNSNIANKLDPRVRSG